MIRNFCLFFFIIITLNSFGQLSVDRATGRGAAIIPIHTVGEGKLAVPITLSYDASGIQVGANSSRVGLNWSLNTVGQIVRVVRDLPDEGWTQVYINNNPVLAEWNYLTHADAPLLVADKKWAAFRDCEPDLFILTLNGQSYPFYMGPSTGTSANVLKPKVVLVKQEQDISIEPIVAANKAATYSGKPNYTLEDLLGKNGEIMGLLGFKVTDTNGTVYYFGESSAEREYAFTYDSYKNYSNYLFHNPFLGSGNNLALSTSAPYAWKISRMLLPKVASQTGENYQQVTFTYKRTRSMRLQYPAILDKEYTVGYNELAAGNTPDTTLRNGSGPLNGSNLQTIAAGCGTTPVLKNSLCLQGPNNCLTPYDRLIQLEASLESIEGVTFKVSFNATSLLTGAAPANIQDVVVDYVSGSFSSTQDKSILEADQTSIPETNIIDGRANPILALPATPLLRNVVILDKKSNTQLGYYLDYDYYNYYFNQIQNQGLYEIPYAQLKLKGIYPIVFESGGLKLDNGYTFTYIGGALPEPSSAARDYWGYANGKDDNLAKTGFVGTTPECKGTQSDLSASLDFAQLGSLRAVKLPTGGTTSFVYELHDGNYFDGFDAVYSPTSADTVGFKQIGGLRVKQIMTSDPLRQSIYKTNYTYKITDSPGARSSGFLSVWPDQFSYYRSDHASYVVPSQFALITNRFINGHYITYSRVKEEQIASVNGSELANGYTVYTFTIGEEGVQPFTQPSYFYSGLVRPGYCYSRYSYEGTLPGFSYLKGTPKAIRVYNKNGTLLNETYFSYSVTDKRNELGLKAGVKLIPTRIRVDSKDILASSIQGYAGLASNAGFLTQASLIGNIFYFSSLAIINSISLSNPVDQTDYSKLKSYTTPVAVVSLTEKKEVSYSLDGTTSLSAVTQYFYESTAHHQPTKIVSDYASGNNVNGSTASKQEMRLKYNTDYNLASSSTKNDELKGIEALTLRKVIVPVETVTLKNERVIAASYTQFNGDNSAPNTYGLPAKLWALELDSPVPVAAFTFSTVGSGSVTKSALYKPRKEILGYNTRGLLTSIIDSDNPSLVNTSAYDATGLLPATNSISTPSGKLYTTAYEYAIPMFGASKVTSPDGTFMTSEYDGLGRQKVLRDLNGNVVKTYGYTSVGTPSANDQLSIQLQPAQSSTSGPTKSLSNGTVVTRAEILEIQQQQSSAKINLSAIPSAGQSLVYDLKGPSASGPNAPINKQTTVKNLSENYAFDSRYGFGFVPVAGTYTLTVKAYSQEEGQGILLSQKTIQFTLQQ